MFFIILNDYPFEIEKPIVDWQVSACFLNQEVSLAKENNNIIISFISEDENVFNYKNVVKVSYDNGNTFLGDFEFTFWTNYCYVGDPVVAIKNNTFYHVGVIYCTNNNKIYGEIYFCSCSNSCDLKVNWNCKILNNDNWQFFKDKPWIYIYNNRIVLLFTTDKFSGYPQIVGYLSLDNGNNFNNVFILNVPSTYAYISDDKIGNLFISYNDFSQNNKIGFGILKSQDGGQNFNDLGVAYFSYSNTTCQDFKRPAKISNYITCYNNKCAIAYLDDNCFLKVLIYQNNSFNFYNVYNQQSVLPIIQSYNNHLYIIFQSIVGSTINNCPVIGQIKQWATFWTHSSNWGQTWTNPARVSSVNYGFSENPSGHDYLGFVVDNGYLYTAWGNDFRSNEGAKVYFTKTPSSNQNEFKNQDGIFKIYRVDGSYLGIYNKNSKLKSGVYILKSKNNNKILLIK